MSRFEGIEQDNCATKNDIYTVTGTNAR